MRPGYETSSETPLEVLLRLADEHPGRRPEFYRALLDSQVVVASANDGPGGMTTQIAALLTLEGEQVIPFFTSVRALREMFPEVRFCTPLPARQLFETACGRTLHLNPGSTFGRTFTAEEVALLLSTGMIAQAERFTSDGPMEVIEVEVPPVALITALTDLYSRTPEVETAFLAQIGGEANTTATRLLLALEMKAPAERVIHATATVVRDIDEAQQLLVDVIVFDQTSDLPWAQDFREKVKPFYQSSWGSRMLTSVFGQLS